MQVREAVAAKTYYAAQVKSDNILDICKFIFYYAMKDAPVLNADGEPEQWKIEMQGFTKVLNIGDWVVVSKDGIVETFDEEDFEKLFFVGNVSLRLETSETNL